MDTTTTRPDRALATVLALATSTAGCAPLVYRYRPERASLDAGTAACVLPKRKVVLHEIRRDDGTCIDGGPWGGDTEICLSPGNYEVDVSFNIDMGGVGVAAVESVTAKMTLRGGCIHVVDAEMTQGGMWHPKAAVSCNDVATAEPDLVGNAPTLRTLSQRNLSDGQ